MLFFKSLITGLRKFLKTKPANPVDSTPAPGETIGEFNERRESAAYVERHYTAGESQGKDD